jgi:hypothetical protein
MMREYDKCRFCKWYSIYDGCTNGYCYNKQYFEADERKIIEKAEESGMSVADIIALMNLGE